jgi:hypothetical protein
MGFSDITGIFSRFFVVGFYLPSFFALFAIDLVVTTGRLSSPCSRSMIRGDTCPYASLTFSADK